MSVLNVETLHPGLSVDCVIFGFHQNELKVLVMKLKGSDVWAVPGGFVEKNENVDDAAVHILKQRVGLEHIFLKQFHLFGDVDRNVNGHAANLVSKSIIPADLLEWFSQRFITVGYYALVEYSKVKAPQPDYTSEYCGWCSLKELPPLMLDHTQIVTKAYEALKAELNHHPIGLDLLPERFTMPELQALYETILNKKLDRRNFRRKMLSFDILIATDERRTGGAHKSPLLYTFDKEKYRRAVKNGLNSAW